MKPIKYGEIVINALQKAMINQTPLNIQDMEALKTDNRYSLYIDQIPNLLNECLYILSTRGKSYIKNEELFAHDASYETDKCLFFDLGLVYDNYKSLSDVIIDNIENSNRYYIRNGDTLIIAEKVFKEHRIFVRYKAYIDNITNMTPMLQNLDIPREYIILAPLYIASELLKEERPDLSVQIRNQFEAELGQLSETQNTKNQTDIYGYL